MATGRFQFSILNPFKFIFLGVSLLGSPLVFGAAAQQSYQSSIVANTSEGTSETLTSLPPKSTLQISDPGPGTVWTVSETAKIE
ncbi:MAG: hypothetical protein WBG48_07360, partial [Pricia sp.]